MNLLKEGVSYDLEKPLHSAELLLFLFLFLGSWSSHKSPFIFLTAEIAAEYNNQLARMSIAFQYPEKGEWHLRKS